MSSPYTALNVSPKKKRCPPDQGELVLTPKKLRTAPPTPPSTLPGKIRKSTVALPSHLSRLHTVQTALQHALSHALATCAVSPSSDTGIVRNVLNQFSLTTYVGLTTKFDVDDLRRLCWLWEWDGEPLPDPKNKPKLDNDDENPFLERTPAPQPKDWTRGGMGLVVSPTSHYAKDLAKRVPAYGIGIEVEMDIDKDMKGGMAAVARWTAASETRLREFRQKLDRWVNIHSDVEHCPNVPPADLPQLCLTAKVSSLTRVLASGSPNASPLPVPLSPERSPSKSPTKKSVASREFAVPFPVTPFSQSKVKGESKSSRIFPQTPSRRDRSDPSSCPPTPCTPSSSTHALDPSTPSPQKGTNASTRPETPTSSRRQALYERVRQRSLAASPTKPGQSEFSKDQMLKMSQDEMRRRCLLGRMGGVAESVWMLFSTPAASGSSPNVRKRRALPASEVANAVIKSSPVPISTAEATQSLSILTELCPFFLKPLEIAGVDWLEMPGTNLTAEGAEVSAPPSPSRKKDSAEVLVTRSPKRVKREAGGLREVREIIRKELELQD